MKVKPGGTEGGVVIFFVGAILAILGIYLFFDSVVVRADGRGWLTHAVGLGSTTSMGVLFVPFVAGIIMMFYNAKNKIGWAVAGIGVAILAIEILSRIRFGMNVKTTHLLLMLGMFGAGVGLMLRGYFVETKSEDEVPTSS